MTNVVDNVWSSTENTCLPTCGQELSEYKNGKRFDFLQSTTIRLVGRFQPVVKILKCPNRVLTRPAITKQASQPSQPSNFQVASTKKRQQRAHKLV